MRSFAVRALFVSAALLCCRSSALAQGTFASVSGTVTDASGAVVPQAQVQATRLESNYTYTTTSNEAGIYVLTGLLEGHYTVRATMSGFKEFVATDVQLVSRDVRRLDIKLEVGVTESRIEVSAGGGTLIETETARIADVKTDRLLQYLPMNSRSPSALILLTPAVFSVPGLNMIRYAGSRWGDQTHAIDGVKFSTAWDGSPMNAESFMESFKEMRVDVANNSAEFSSFGQMTLVSKSGTNQLRGSFFDYYTTSGLNARNPFALTKGTFVNHSVGGAIGGPVVLPRIYDGRNKTFFYFSIETLRGGQQTQLLNPTVALPAWREGDFSGTGQNIVDPIGKTPFPNRRIPASRINPVSQKIQEMFWPLPNFGDPTVFVPQNYRQTLTYPFDPNTLWTPRIDHRFSDKLFVYGRYRWSQYWARGYDGNLPTIGRRFLPVKATHAVVSATATFTPTVINEATFGRMHRPANRHPAPNGLELVRQLGFQGLAADLPNIQGIPSLGFTGIGLTGLSVTYPWILSEFGPQYQFQDNITVVRGQHTFKAGFEVGRFDFLNGTAPTDLFGGFTFSNRFTGFPYADYLLGIPTTSSRGFPPVVTQIRRWTYDFFAQDEFKVRPNLTLSFGLRYELHPNWRSLDGKISLFDIGTGKIVVPDGALPAVSSLMPLNYVDVVEASQAGYESDTLVRTDRNNFAPRVGVAYRPWGSNTVIRAGFGMFYTTLVRNTSISGTTPFQVAQPAFVNPADNPVVIWPLVFPETGSRPSTVSLPSAMKQDLRVPYSLQYNFTLERQQWGTGFRASYVGTAARQGQYSYDINQPLPDTRRYVEKPRLFPRYPGIGYATNGAGHQYHSLVLEATRRYGSNLAYQFSYTLARDIGDLDWYESPENAYDRRRERAVAISIPTHSVRSYMAYQLPVGRGRRFAGGAGRVLQQIVGGWELNLVFTADTGMFLTPAWQGPDPTGTSYSTSLTPIVVTRRPDAVHNPNLPSDQRSVKRWFDASAFTAPAPGQFGTSAKGVIIGPGQYTLNTGLAKYFDLHERLRLRTEITATNALNHPSWGNPGTNISAVAAVGVITSVRTAPRAVRVAARVEW